jgi:hypothetical protein
VGRPHDAGQPPAVFGEASQPSKFGRLRHRSAPSLKRIFDLWLACYTQQEIADAVGIPQQTVASSFTEFGDIAKLGKTQQADANHATDFDLPIYIFDLWLACHSTDEIADLCGCGKADVSGVCSKSAELPNLNKLDQANANHATAHHGRWLSIVGLS